jgi:hypothetical protein
VEVEHRVAADQQLQLRCREEIQGGSSTDPREASVEGLELGQHAGGEDVIDVESDVFLAVLVRHGDGRAILLQVYGADLSEGLIRDLEVELKGALHIASEAKELLESAREIRLELGEVLEGDDFALELLVDGLSQGWGEEEGGKRPTLGMRKSTMMEL